MIQNLRIITLVENSATRAGLLAEHGLAYWIEADGTRILFDTGQGEALLPNARQLGIDPISADLLVLSHGHFDHAGALDQVLPPSWQGPIYLHPDALEPKYACRPPAPPRDIGIPPEPRQALLARRQDMVWTASTVELVPGVHVTGEVPRQNDQEDTGGPFFLDEAGTCPDPLKDDQALFVDTSQGTVVISGCAHSGIVNILDHVAEQTGAHPIHAVLGGTHLVSADSSRLAFTVEAFRRHKVDRLVAVHCTGRQASHYLWSHLGDRCADGNAGTIFTFGDQEN